MSTHIEEQLDDWEAGELSVEFEGQEPWDLLEWAIDRFGGRLAHLDRVPGRRCRADRHGPQDRPGRSRVLDGPAACPRRRST